MVWYSDLKHFAWGALGEQDALNGTPGRQDAVIMLSNGAGEECVLG